MRNVKRNYIVEASIFDREGREVDVSTQFGDDMNAALRFITERKSSEDWVVHKMVEVTDIHEENVLVDIDEGEYFGVKMTD